MPHCLASAPSSSSCYKGHDDLKSEVFQAITVCFLSHLQRFYFCNVHLDCFSGPSSIPCDTALSIWVVRFGNQFIYLFLRFTKTLFSCHGRTQHLLETFAAHPRRQLVPRFCCSPEQQQVQAGLCQEIPSAGSSPGRHFFWAAEISHKE